LKDAARLLGEPRPLHDVRDPEAHVRALLDSRLATWGAHLNADLYEDALTFLLGVCWELGGLNADGGARAVWFVQIWLDPEELVDAEGPEELGPFTSIDRCNEVAEAQMHRGFIVSLRAAAPKGAYDASLGLSFSTYSRRILTNRVVDWYRRTFHDSRYGAGQQPELSLNAMASVSGEPIEEFLDTLTDGTDPNEEVLTRVALGG
jgi:hypothetical protein